jgi:HEPN domain-containing protein
MPGGGWHELAAAARRWLAAADTDLRVVRLCLGADPITEAAAYHCQQALEKIAKGYLVLGGIPFRETHSIDELAARVTAVDPPAGAELTRLAWVTAWGFAYRYPEEEPEPSPTREEVAAVLASVDALRANLARRIGG